LREPVEAKFRTPGLHSSVMHLALPSTVATGILPARAADPTQESGAARADKMPAATG
jgi:hypothetical protein